LPSSSSLRRAVARRALIADITTDRKGWLQHGIAALAISALGLGVAASVTLTGSAQNTAPHARPAAVEAIAQPNPKLATRAAGRGTWDAAKLRSLADQRAEELAEASEDYATAASTRSAKARDKALESAAAATRRQAEQLADQQGPTITDGDVADLSDPYVGAIPSDGKSCLPITSGYSIAARFGDTGIWSRYHTGFDFSTGVGTPIHAPSAGVVTNAGLGPASGWAGNYVAIRYPDGTSTLMAHMSTVSVSVGQTVAACQVVGAVGLTGRTFGPHLHFEVYPAGVTPGDVYSAVSPVSWLNARGLNP
jgi:murein DD-endopeptidase MepM/ murein hydrolase activator NlpD